MKRSINTFLGINTLPFLLSQNPEIEGRTSKSRFGGRSRTFCNSGVAQTIPFPWLLSARKLRLHSIVMSNFNAKVQAFFSNLFLKLPVNISAHKYFLELRSQVQMLFPPTCGISMIISVNFLQRKSTTSTSIVMIELLLRRMFHTTML